jgi:hypothetical protein
MSEFDIKCCLGRVKKLLEVEPSLLELEAPIKVVGDMYVSHSLCSHYLSDMASSLICSNCLDAEDFRPRTVTFFWATMWIEGGLESSVSVS